MKFENTEVWGFEHALRGMRNPMNSWDKKDSWETFHMVLDTDNRYSIARDCRIGENDMKLAQKLIRAGSEHRKFMRQIFVSVDITAPLYWWKEFDTYKVGTVANSTSTMHKLATTPIRIDCFETDDMLVDRKDCIGFELYLFDQTHQHIEQTLEFLEHLRKKYLETKDQSYWKELIRWLPESWLQTRTVTMSYENLLAMCSKGQRRFHKLTEWSNAFISWARSLPYAQDLIFLDELEEVNE